MKPRPIALLLLLTLLVGVTGTVYAQTPTLTAVTYSDDPNTWHVRMLGANPVVYASNAVGISTLFDFGICGGAISGTINTLGYEQFGGLIPCFSSVSVGSVIMVTAGAISGSVSCTMTMVGPYRYCGISADNDNDGVPNYQDSCVDTPGPASNAGCPVPDSDGDSITDDVDQCPSTPGVAPTGCPDADGDGIYDPPFPGTTDLCPATVGVAPNGCPDADGDGIYDAPFPGTIDDCPTTVGVAPYGCPDFDGDTVYDPPYTGTPVDQCPTDPGPASNNGCPIPQDRDGDGILDADDVCPDEFGFVDSTAGRGCPKPPTPEPTAAVVVTPIRTPTPPPAVIRPNAPCNLISAVTQRVRVRTEPNTGAEVVDYLYEYEGPYPVISYRLDEQGNGWYEIEVRGERRWIAADFVEIGGQGCSYHSISEDYAAIQVGDNLSTAIVNTMSDQCPALVPGFSDYMLTTVQNSEALARALASQVGNAADICATVRGILDGSIVIETSETAQINLIISRCLPKASPKYLDTVAEYIRGYRIDLPKVINKCEVVINAAILGKMDVRESAFYEGLVSTCDTYARSQALRYLRFGLEIRADLEGMTKELSTNQKALCTADGDEGLLRQLEKTGGTAGIQPEEKMIMGMSACPTYAALLARLKLSSENNDKLLVSVDPCRAGWSHLLYRSLPTGTTTVVAGTGIPAGVSVSGVSAPPILDAQGITAGGSASGAGQGAVAVENWALGSALFSAKPEGGSSTDIYLLAPDGTYYPLTPNTPEDETSPAALGEDGVLVYFSTDQNTGVTSIIYHLHLYESGAGRITAPDGYTFDPRSRLEITSGSLLLWATVRDAQGNPSIIRIHLGSDGCFNSGQNPPNCPATIVLENSANPAVIGQNLYYERWQDGYSMLEFQLLDQVFDKGGTVFNAQPDDRSCISPAPWFDQRVLFACRGSGETNATIYVAGGAEGEPLYMNTNRDAVFNISKIRNTELYLTFDDGNRIFIRPALPGGTVAEFLKVGSLTSGLRWLSD